MEAQKRGLEDWKMNFLLTFGEDPQVTWGYPVDIKHGDQKSVDVLNIGNTCKDRFVSSYIWGIFERQVRLQECRCKACAFFLMLGSNVNFASVGSHRRRAERQIYHNDHSGWMDYRKRC